MLRYAGAASLLALKYWNSPTAEQPSDVHMHAVCLKYGEMHLRKTGQYLSVNFLLYWGGASPLPRPNPVKKHFSKPVAACGKRHYNQPIAEHRSDVKIVPHELMCINAKHRQLRSVVMVTVNPVGELQSSLENILVATAVYAFSVLFGCFALSAKDQVHNMVQLAPAYLAA